MQCKACSTRIDPGRSVCPNCGRTTGSTLAAESAPTREKAKSSADRKPAARSKSAGGRKVAASSKASAQSKAETQGQSKAETQVVVAKAIDLELEDIADAVVEDLTVETPRVPSQGWDPKPAELRALLAEQPELLEADLSVMTGKKRGVGFSTDVGEIDLLLVDEAENLVVVSIPELDSPNDPVSAVLQRIGWVRKHLAEDQEVRGIVLLPTMSEDLSYAAAGVAGMVAFRTYRVSIHFEDLEF